NALKHTPLFQHVSQRLLADVVAKHGLDYVPPPPGKIALSAAGLAILVVLEGAITPLVPPPPPIFDVGTYVRQKFNPLSELGPATEFTTTSTDAVRVLVLDNNEITALPPMIVNALDLVQLVDMNDSL